MFTGKTGAMAEAYWRQNVEASCDGGTYRLKVE
jgi:hypothetical protein